MASHLPLFPPTVKPGQPINVTVRNVSGNELLLTWETPFHASDCLEHTVKYQTNKDSGWTVRDSGRFGAGETSPRPRGFCTHSVLRFPPQQYVWTELLWAGAAPGRLVTSEGGLPLPLHCA